MSTPTLTAEDIDAMQPGPEMDALVAEWVMGYTFTRWSEQDIYHRGMGVNPRNGMDECFPMYSSDITAAWSVVVHFRQRGWSVEVIGEDSFTTDQWLCRLSFPDGGTWDAPLRDDAVAYGPDAPTAIGRAALKTTL